MAKSNGLKKKQQEIVRRSPSPTPPPSPMKSNRTAYNNGSTRTTSAAVELKLQQSIESDEGGYDYHQEAMMTSSGSGRQTEVVNVNSNDSEAAAEIVEEEEDRCDDAASETGTYTIGKDSPSPDEDQSRRDIDRVFGLLPPTALSNQSDSSLSTVVGAVGQVDSIESRSTPQWIREWAAQVAQQQEAPLAHIVSLPANVAKPPSHPRPPPPELPTAQRPRRRLPSVPPGASNGSSRSRSSPRPSDMSDPSDSSLETESFLRDTESVVSAMQVKQKQHKELIKSSA